MNKNDAHAIAKWMADLTTVLKPVDVFAWYKMEAGYTPEFPMSILATGVEREGQPFLLPARGCDPIRATVTAEDTIYVPHFEISHEHEEGQKAIDAFNQEVNDHAWKLLKAAADLNGIFGTGTIRELRDQMKLHFAKLHNVDEKNVVIKLCQRENQLIGVYQNDSVILTDHSDGPQFWHTLHMKPTCWLDAGYAVLDHRNVLEARVCESKSS